MVGIVLGAVMFGDIGIACIIGALSAFLSGIGFLAAAVKRSAGLKKADAVRENRNRSLRRQPESV